MAALDYRDWHEFRVIQVTDGRREVLTRRRHQQGSGGEKAVALHLPLFAAAAAQFAAARERRPTDDPARRGVRGIDERMRAQLLGLLERFDLDFVLTSHELWGCYPECSALGIYHLHREPGIPGVATAHFRWDGERRVEVVGRGVRPARRSGPTSSGRRCGGCCSRRGSASSATADRSEAAPLTALTPEEALALNGLLEPGPPFAAGTGGDDQAAAARRRAARFAAWRLPGGGAGRR